MEFTDVTESLTSASMFGCFGLLVFFNKRQHCIHPKKVVDGMEKDVFFWGAAAKRFEGEIFSFQCSTEGEKCHP